MKIILSVLFLLLSSSAFAATPDKTSTVILCSDGQQWEQTNCPPDLVEIQVIPTDTTAAISYTPSTSQGGVRTYVVQKGTGECQLPNRTAGIEGTNADFFEYNAAVADTEETVNATGLTADTDYCVSYHWYTGTDASPGAGRYRAILGSQFTTTGVATPPATERGPLLFSANWETGQHQPNGSLVDGGFPTTLPLPPIGGEGICIVDNSRGNDPLTSLSGTIAVTTSDTVVINGGTPEEITPRAGNYFLRIELPMDIEYGPNNGDYTCLDPIKDRVRGSLSFSNPTYRGFFDVEYWMGYSMFIPTDWEIDQATPNGNLNARTVQIFELGTDSASTNMEMGITTPLSTSTESSYKFRYNVNATNSSEANGVETYIDSLEHDRGVWTDWVIRFRWNPFLETTVVADNVSLFRGRTIGGTYEGNKGIVEIWKEVGASRTFTKVFSRVNQPVGVIPHEYFYGGVWTGPMLAVHKNYNFTWDKLNDGSQSTSTRNGPIILAWDEFYITNTEINSNPCNAIHPNPTVRVCP